MLYWSRNETDCRASEDTCNTVAEGGECCEIGTAREGNPLAKMGLREDVLEKESSVECQRSQHSVPHGND